MSLSVGRLAVASSSSASPPGPGIGVASDSTAFPSRRPGGVSASTSKPWSFSSGKAKRFVSPGNGLGPVAPPSEDQRSLPPLTSSAGLDEEQFRLPPQTRAVGAIEIADHLLHRNALPVRPNDGARNLDVVALEEARRPSGAIPVGKRSSQGASFLGGRVLQPSLKKGSNGPVLVVAPLPHHHVMHLGPMAAIGLGSQPWYCCL